jgi:hypothetical protein
MSALVAPALALGLIVQQLSAAPPAQPEPPAAAPASPPVTAPAPPAAAPPADWPYPPPPPPAPPPVPQTPASPYPGTPAPPPDGWPPPPPPSASPYPPAEATLTATLPRTGLFARGLGLNLLQLGPMQAISSGGTSWGIDLATGVEIDLGPHLALRVPIEIAYAGSDNNDAAGVEQSTVFVFAGLSPGIVYRFRSERDQRWVAYLGGALKLGGYMFGRRLLGVAPNPPPATMQEFTISGAAPNLAAGLLCSPARWFALRIALDYTYIYVAHASVHVLTETLGPQFSF